MTAFPLVAFDTAPGVGSVVFVIASHGDDGGNFGAIVGSKNHDGVVGDVEVIESFEKLSGHPVHFVNEISVGSGFRRALKFL